jgi:hypothetical protein
MNELEQAILDKLLAGDDPLLSILRQQASTARVADRDYTGVGFFTSFTVPPTSPRLTSATRLVIGDVYAEVHDLEHPAGFLLFVSDGVIRTLECFIIDDKFPDNPRLERAYYVRPASQNSASLVETKTRDLNWALRDRAA